MVNKQEINKTESFAELFAEQIKQDDKKRRPSCKRHSNINRERYDNY